MSAGRKKASGRQKAGLAGVRKRAKAAGRNPTSAQVLATYRADRAANKAYQAAHPNLPRPGGGTRGSVDVAALAAAGPTAGRPSGVTSPNPGYKPAVAPKPQPGGSNPRSSMSEHPIGRRPASTTATTTGTRVIPGLLIPKKGSVSMKVRPPKPKKA